MPASQDWDLLTEADIAHYLNVATTTIRVWRIRGILAEPVALVGGVPVWARQTVKTMADRLPGFSPALRDDALWLLRSRTDAVGFDEVVAHFLGKGLLTADVAASELAAILTSLEGEGYLIALGDRQFRGVAKLEAEGFDLRCLAALGEKRRQDGGGAAVNATTLSEQLGLAGADLSRVAAALTRLHDAGLVFPASVDGGYGDLTPAGERYLAEMGSDQRLAGVTADRWQARRSMESVNL